MYILASVVNLFKLIKEKGRLPQINTVVDVYNVASVESSIAMATHDVHKIELFSGQILRLLLNILLILGIFCLNLP